MSRYWLALAVLAVTACNSTAPKSAAAATPLAGTRWTLTHVGALTAQSETEAPGWLQIDGDKVQGHTGCNSLTGSVTTDQTSPALSFGPIATTKRYCPRSAAIESALLEALRQTHSARIEGSSLQLLDAEGVTLAALQAETTPLQ